MCSNIAIRYLNFWLNLFRFSNKYGKVRLMLAFWSLYYQLWTPSIHREKIVLLLLVFTMNLLAGLCHISLYISGIKWLEAFLNQEIRNRHWLQVMHVTKKSFQLEANIFKLKHILDIGLTQWVTFILHNLLFSWRMKYYTIFEVKDLKQPF